MTTPGVGPVVALTYRATVDVPARFRKSKSVGAVFGLTCSRYQSGEIDWSGKISRCGDEMMRTMLYEAAQSMMHSKKWSWLKAWAMQIARRRGMKKAIVALARRLAVILHRIWVDGTEFRWTREQAAAAACKPFRIKPDRRKLRTPPSGGARVSFYWIRCCTVFMLLLWPVLGSSGTRCRQPRCGA